MRSKQLLRVTYGAMIAALYVLLTFVGAPLASGAIQVRFSEALCVTAFFTPAAVPGLAVGCLLANLLLGAPVWDVLFGTLATLLGAAGTWFLRRRPVLALFPPVLANALILPAVIAYSTMAAEDVTPALLTLYALSVGAGETVSCVLIGLPFEKLLDNHRERLFPFEEKPARNR